MIASSYRLVSVKHASCGETNRKRLYAGGRRGKLRAAAKNMGRKRDRLATVSPKRHRMDSGRSSRTLGKPGAGTESKARAYLRRACSSFQRFIGNVEGKC